VLGQIPIYYNHEPTGRPCDVTFKWNARYRDLNYCDALYPFGYGLSYTTFSVQPAPRHAERVEERTGHATVDVTNTGSRKGDDVVQLYIHDPVASISQPVRRLRGFQRVTLMPGREAGRSASRSTRATSASTTTRQVRRRAGKIDVYAGDSSTAALQQSFTVRREMRHRSIPRRRRLRRPARPGLLPARAGLDEAPRLPNRRQSRRALPAGPSVHGHLDTGDLVQGGPPRLE
jgi:beta-glucosidase